MTDTASASPLTTVLLEQLQAQPIAAQYLAAALEEHYPDDGGGLPLRYSYAWQHLNRGRYAEQALLAGAMECVDTRSGELLRSTAAWVLPGAWLGIAYEFAGVERFFLVTSSFDQAKLGIWFPQHELFVAGQVDANWIQIGSDCVENLRTQLSRAQPWRSAPRYNAAARPGVLYLGFCNNLGHYMWNELSGLEAVLQAGSEHKVDTVVAGPYEFFPIDKVFPELEHAGIRIQRWTKPLPNCVLHQGTLPLRVIGNRISRKLRQRIVAWALETCSSELAELERYNDTALNLWFNLRQHNKAWAGQVEGIALIAESVLQSLPATRSLRLLLDGTPDTGAIAGILAKRFDGRVEVVDATCVPLARTIALASLIDLHVCVIGSGLTLPHWVMGRRGVAHSNRSHIGQQSFWNNVSEGAHDVSFVDVQSITDHAGPVIPDASYVNYDVSPAAIIAELNASYRQHDIGLRISGVRQMIALALRGDWTQAAERVISI